MNSVKCPQCNLTNWSTAEVCKRCKYNFQTGEAGVEMTAPPIAANDTAFGGDQFSSHTQNYQSQNYQAQYSQAPQNYYQPDQSYQNYQQPGYYQSPANLKSGLAIASMVLGILSFIGAMFLFGIITAPIGLILGIIALVKAGKKPHLYGGKAFAIVGVVLNTMIVVFIPIVAAIAIPNLLAARRAANEGSAISSMRTLSGAQATYIATSGTGKCGDLQELGSVQLIDSRLATGEKSGYKFSIVKSPLIKTRCEITAVPIVSKGVSSTGIRSFYMATDENVLRAANKNGLAADKTDAPLENSYGNSYQTGYPQKPQVSRVGPNDY